MLAQQPGREDASGKTASEHEEGQTRMAAKHSASQATGHLSQRRSLPSSQDGLVSGDNGAAQRVEPSDDHALLALIPAMLFAAHPDGVWEYASPPLCAYIGSPAEALTRLG
jgi:hypothetical protein